MGNVYQDLLAGFVEDCVNGGSGRPIQPGHIRPRRVVCKDHLGGPLELQEGVEPTIETECYQCQVPRMERARRAAFWRDTRWQRWRAQTPEEIAAAPDPFRGFRKGD